MSVIAINNKGWTRKEDHATAWLAPRTQRTLPNPQLGPVPATLAVMLAAVLTLKPLQAEQLVEWVTSACNPTPLPHPPLVLIGTARHQAALLLRDLIDPSTTPFQVTPSKDHHLQVFLEVTRLSNAQRRLSQPAIYTNAAAIQQAELPLTINVMECNRPEISNLLAALCSALSEQQVAELTEEPQYLQMEAAAGTENLFGETAETASQWSQEWPSQTTDPNNCGADFSPREALASQEWTSPESVIFRSRGSRSCGCSTICLRSRDRKSVV